MVTSTAPVSIQQSNSNTRVNSPAQTTVPAGNNMMTYYQGVYQNILSTTPATTTNPQTAG